MIRRIHYDIIDSTNSEARRLVTPELDAPLLVTAAEQFAGRGRHGRSWRSPRGGAWMSLIWPARQQPAAYSAISLAAAVGVLRGLREVAKPGADFRIKWPNDVLIHDCKVAGILCEQRLGGGSQAEAVIVGVGVNVDFDIAELPCDLRHPATTLRAAFGKPLAVDQVINAVTDGLVESLQTYETQGLNQELLAEIRENLAYVGSVKAWRSSNGLIEGRVVGVDGAGRLLLDCPTGQVACEVGEFDHQESERSRM
jgi:BirA family biotin operon repressor/biotin-[acetyl-CoA-carboxylase] ligase